MPDGLDSGDEESSEATPKIAGIIGGVAQVARSLSPAIHNAAFKALEMDWEYKTFGLPEEGLIEGIYALVSGGVAGMNVTMPHKVGALQAMDWVTDAAKAIGAINTVEVGLGGRLEGHNTDGEGLRRFLEMDAGVELRGTSALILGAGGSARAVVHALGKAGVGLIVVAARDAGKAKVVADLAGDPETMTVDLEDLSEAARGSQIIINATPVGQKGEPSLVESKDISPDAVVVDLVYRPPVTGLIEAARARGAMAHSGLGMLLHQASLSFEIWTGVEPPLEVMSAAALGALSQQ